MISDQSSMRHQTVELRPELGHPCLDVMNFLNEAAERYPQAISFAAGRPPDRFASAELASQWISRFVQERARRKGCDEGAIWRSLAQYGPAAGMINDLVARLLQREDGISVDPADLVITNGMQEALFLLLACICNRTTDVVLADDPTYVGLMGAAAVSGVSAVPLTGDGALVDRAMRAISQLSGEGRRARALYVVPDFSNPLGGTLSLSERRALLDMAERERLVLIEDTAYRAFRYEGEWLPTLEALDSEGVVVQVGSFSKLFMPGPRVGYLHAGQRVRGSATGETLAQAVAKAKSFVSVLTSPLAQAIVGGFLFEHEFSLERWNEPRLALCRSNRDALLAALEELIGCDHSLSEHVSWERPKGGFFLPLRLPFRFGVEEMSRCAREYGLIVCPMSFFSGARAFEAQIRLSFSNLTAELAREGVHRLHRFVRDEMVRRAT